MELRQLRPQVRKEDVAAERGGQGITDAGVQGTHCGSSIAAATRRLKTRLVPRALKGKFFIEVFSGSGRLSLSLISQDVAALTFDIIDGPDCNLLRAEVR